MPNLRRMVSIDPGDKHVGVASWTGDKLAWSEEAESPGKVLVWVKHWTEAGALDELVVEEFRLYPDKARAQGYSSFPTVEMIGVLRYLAALAGVPFVLQGASVKKPTFAIMARRGVALPAGSQHVKDAICHGYYRLHRAEKGFARVKKQETTDG